MFMELRLSSPPRSRRALNGSGSPPPAMSMRHQKRHIAKMTDWPLSTSMDFKVQGEQLIQLAAREQPQTHFVIGRLFNLYGPRETNPHIVPEIVKQLREHPMAALRLGNLWPKRELIPISEAARVIIESTLQAPSGVTTVNVASGAAWSMQEVIDLLGELLGRKIEVETDPARVRPTERAHLQADVTQLRELLGWTPHHDLRRGLTDLLTVEGML